MVFNYFYAYFKSIYNANIGFFLLNWMKNEAHTTTPYFPAKSFRICPANSIRLSRVRLGLVSDNSLSFVTKTMSFFFRTLVGGTSLNGNSLSFVTKTMSFFFRTLVGGTTLNGKNFSSVNVCTRWLRPAFYIYPTCSCFSTSNISESV